MTHIDHVKLIKKGIKENSGGVWADLGSGRGAFTLALRDIAGPGVEIYSIDKDEQSLREQKKAFDEKFPNSKIHYLHSDFTHLLDMPKLDGVIMANSLHFYENKKNVLLHVVEYLRKTGSLLLVEYNVDQGNEWVPYPLSFHTFEKLAKSAQLQKPELLGTIPSHFLHEIYAAKAVKQPEETFVLFA